jgi:hypothetical protein
MNNLRLILGKSRQKNEIPRKNLLHKSSKLPKFGYEMLLDTENI